MIEVDLLCDVAAHRLAPTDLKAGRAQIDTLVKPLYRRLNGFNTVRIVTGALGAIVTVAGFAIVANAPHEAGVGVIQTITVAAASVFMLSWLGGRSLQRRKHFFTNRPYDVDLPAEIEQLLVDLASGRLRAVMPAKYGSVSTSALRATDGQLFDTEIAPATFSNRSAPILFLSDPKTFSALWMPWGQAVERPIYVVREPMDQSEGEAVSLNHDPRDQWLVGGMLRDFERGREAFIADRIPAHNAEWFRIVLTVGRRELRKGRQRGAQRQAIFVIQGELKARLGSDLGVRGGDSEPQIKQLLQGRYGDADIMGYFTPAED